MTVVQKIRLSVAYLSMALSVSLAGDIPLFWKDIGELHDRYLKIYWGK